MKTDKKKVMGRRKKSTVSLEEQVAVINEVCQATGLSYDELAGIVNVVPDTMRKYRTGVQPAGEQTLANIRNVPFMPTIQAKLRGATLPANKSEPPISSLMHHPSIIRLVFILQNATSDERQMVTSVINGVFKQLNNRLEDADKTHNRKTPRK